MEIQVTEDEPGRLTVRVGDRSLTAMVPAGVGVPGASDEDLVETVVEVLLERDVPLPDPLDVTQVLRAHPHVWAEVEARLD